LGQKNDELRFLSEAEPSHHKRAIGNKPQKTRRKTHATVSGC
jgi:hypothetical protein